MFEAMKLLGLVALAIVTISVSARIVQAQSNCRWIQTPFGPVWHCDERQGPYRPAPRPYPPYPPR